MNKSNNKFRYYIFPIFLILVLSASRLIPHPSNFTPILAVGIFSGFYFRSFVLSFFVVIVSMFIGDLLLGFHNTMFFTYASLILVILIGSLIKNFKFKEILFSGIAGSLCFFIITNFGAWLTLEIYEKNINGLIAAYNMATPFFHNTLISTFFYLILIKIIFYFAVKKRIAISSF